MHRGTITRILIAGVTAVLLGAVAVAYAVFSARQADRLTPAADAQVTLEPAGQGALVVIDRRLAAVDSAGVKRRSGLECVRVYAAGGTGICLHPDSPWSYSMLVLDSTLHPRKTVSLPGLPNRARVSPSGRMVAWTTFVGGDSYTASGFSTRAGIYDTKTDALVETLEGFAVTREGRAYQAADVNFWGVTFAADDNRFYATMSTAGQRYLVEGDFAARTVRTLRSNVECPSLSPDGRRLAFKQAIDGDPLKGWRLSVLELASGQVTHLAETRSIDDQAAWLDSGTVGYTVRDSAGNPEVWVSPADGSGSPHLLIAGAESPAPLGVPRT